MTQEELQAQLAALSDSQINGAVDETSSDKEDTDWLQYLKGSSATGSRSFFSKYGIVLAAVGVFVAVLLILNYKK